jgi:uncharacterized protein
MKKYFTLFLILFALNSLAQSRENIPFTFKCEGLKLTGEILAPVQGIRKVPVVIFLVGSGGESSIKRYKGFISHFFEQAEAMDSVAIVYFDKRGVGSSEGTWYETNFEQRALDAKNAAEHIKKYSFIDPDQIFVVGHSQGGWIVQICLAQYPETFAGGVSMAGPTFSVKEQIINSYQSDLICAEGYDSKRAYSIAKRKTNEPLGNLFQKQKSTNLNQQQLKLIKDFDPKNYLIQIKKPLLFMWAKNDRLVNPDRCINQLNLIFEDKVPDNFTIYVAEGENHSFQISDFCNSKSPKELVPSKKSRDYMIDWLITKIQ